MTKETQQWLDDNILVGLTHPDYGFGEAWHRKVGSDNSYPGPVPVEDVRRKLFGWTPERITPCNADGKPLVGMDGKSPVALVCSDNGAYLGTFSDRYADTDYQHRLIGNLEEIVQDDLVIAGAGQLDGRRKAYVQIMTENIRTHTATGETYAPFIVSQSSLDGSVKTGYASGVVRVVCDNTLEAFGNSAQSTYRYKNTKDRTVNIESPREALGLLEKAVESFERELEEMIAVHVSEAQWNALTMMISPGDATRAKNAREKMTDVYFTDPMVATFAGTKWGAFQAVNTYQGHYAPIRGATREERNLLNLVSGKAGDNDRETLEMLDKVLATV